MALNKRGFKLYHQEAQKGIKKAWQRVILAGLSQLPSPRLCLTSVFGMGTGVSTVPLSPDFFIFRLIPENQILILFLSVLNYFYKLSPRPISITQLNASLHLHL